MTKRQILMLLGVWTIFFLFMGFPPGWDKLFAIVSGVLMVVISYRLGTSDRKSSDSNNVPFVEHHRDSASPSIINQQQ
ncbi:MAG: hypothetical protein WC648_03785 [Candidatus Paceibacterota bacterium]